MVFPESSANLAFTGQFCKLPDDVVFTVEYSIRSAQHAVYALLGLDRDLPHVYKGIFNPRILLKSFLALQDVHIQIDASRRSICLSNKILIYLPTSVGDYQTTPRIFTYPLSTVYDQNMLWPQKALIMKASKRYRYGLHALRLNQNIKKTGNHWTAR